MEKDSLSSIGSNFKFKNLRTYSSTEWLANNDKKYRQVFDRNEVKYIYAELSFFNKLFDKESWECDVELTCYRANKVKDKVCNIAVKKKISKYDNIAYIREGWGNKKIGSFWKKGKYFWEAKLDGEIVATRYFYIEDPGMGNFDIMNYLSLVNLNFFEGHYEELTSSNEHVYRKGFALDQTRYIFTEVVMENLMFDVDWHCELFFKYYNQQGELKSVINRLLLVTDNPEGTTFTIKAGFGSNTRGSWFAGKYRVEITFMDQILAVSHFDVGEEFVEGSPTVKLPYSQEVIESNEEENTNETFDELIMKLDDMIGLHSIKEKVKDHAKYLNFIKLRKKKGFAEKDKFELFTVFMGNPGTGKTTVAKMMGKLYKKMGLLSKGHVHEVDRVDLVGEYIGQTAPKMKDAIEKAKGGVLFIDEAYSLARSLEDSKDFGREAIEILVKEMSNDNKDMAIIVAGYPKEIKTFISSNPGLKSRFKQFFEFKDYLPQELSQIAEYACREKEVVLDDAAKILLDQIILDAFRNRNKSFGNARFVFDLIEKAKIQLGLRVMDRKKPQEANEKVLQTILAKDIKNLDEFRLEEAPAIPLDLELLDEALSELNSLVGIEDVKKEITEMVEIVKYYKVSGKNVLASFFLHTVFIGNPGTGKTTVARILAKIYKALGVLERGHVVETDRQGLVAGFVGQTAMKTAERIDEAMGGVLFIDEAYALSNFNGMVGDFGNEAIQTLLKRMEDDRGKFFVFAAGYPDNMATFLKANPGLNSRFDKVLQFPDYSDSQLMDIGLKMFGDNGFHLSKKAKSKLMLITSEMVIAKDKYFGNARSIRKLVLETIKQQNLRIAAEKEISRRKMNQILEQDFESISYKDDQVLENKRTRIGY